MHENFLLCPLVNIWDTLTEDHQFPIDFSLWCWTDKLSQILMLLCAWDWGGGGASSLSFMPDAQPHMMLHQELIDFKKRTPLVQCIHVKSGNKMLLHLVATAAVVVYYNITIFSTDLNLPGEYNVTCPLLLWSPWLHWLSYRDLPTWEKLHYRKISCYIATCS